MGHLTFNSIFSDSGKVQKVSVVQMMPLPVEPPRKRAPNRSSRPPSIIYTSPGSLAHIKGADKDALEDYDQPQVKKGRQSKAAKSKAAQSKAAQSKAAQSKAGQSKAAQSKAGQSKAAQSKAAQSKAGQPRRKGPVRKCTPKLKEIGILEKRKVEFMKTCESFDLEMTDEFRMEDLVAIPEPMDEEVGQEGSQLPILAGRSGFRCCICDITHGSGDDPLENDDEDHWIFCPRCHVMSHVTCIRVQKCICGFRPLKKHIRI